MRIDRNIGHTSKTIRIWWRRESIWSKISEDAEYLARPKNYKISVEGRISYTWEE